MHRDLTIESAARLLLFECSCTDIKWWTDALNVLAEAREAEPLKEQQFMATLASVIPGAEGSHIAGVIAGKLNLGERCFVAATIDAFMDLSLCSQESGLSQWMNDWAHIAELLVSAGTLVRQDPSYIDAGRIHDIWNAIRSAVS